MRLVLTENQLRRIVMNHFFEVLKQNDINEVIDISKVELQPGENKTSKKLVFTIDHKGKVDIQS